MGLVVGLGTGILLCGLSALLEQNKNLGLWQHTEWLLMFYWLGFFVTVGAGLRFGCAPGEPRERSRPIVAITGLYLAFALPVLYRATWLLWNFHGHTGKAEGVGWVALTYPAGVALSTTAALGFLRHLRSGPVPAPLAVVSAGALLVQLIPYASVYAMTFYPMGPIAPDALREVSKVLHPLTWLSPYAIGLQVVLQLSIHARQHGATAGEIR